MTYEFHDQVALVTGAGSGIDRASALAFARNGAKVVVSDNAPDAGQETAHLIHDAGGRAIFVRADVSREHEVKRLFAAAISTYDHLDFAHNNAGIGGSRVSLVQLEEEEWDRIININLKGTWRCMKFEISEMLKQNKGAIVNTSSTWGFVGAPTACAYVASKHGIIGLTQTAALKYANEGIRVNAVCPGATRTPLLKLETRPQREPALIATHPLGRNVWAHQRKWLRP